MIHLVYVSNVTREMSEADLVELLQQSRDRNKRQNVTGMLLYAGGNFFQLLEGAEKDVEAIYQAIVQDDRNKGNIVITKEPVDERVFPDWSMGFQALDSQSKDSVEGFCEFLNRDMAREEFANKTDEVLELLYQFKKGNA